MRALLLKKLLGEMWSKDKYGSEEVTVKIKKDESFDLDGSEPYFWELDENDFIVATACENDLMK